MISAVMTFFIILHVFTENSNFSFSRTCTKRALHKMAPTERSALLSPRDARSTAAGYGSAWMQRIVFAALLLLSVSVSLALVRVSTLSNELLARLDQEPPALPPVRLSAVSQPITANTLADNSTRVLIVYSAGTHLSKMAQAVETGVHQVVGQSANVRTRIVDEASFSDDVMWADAVILGSHVINANVEPKMAAFLSTWILSQDLSRKVGAAFVTGGGMSSGEELTMVNLLHSLLIFRMVIVGGERWTSAFGASAIVSEGPFQPVTKGEQEFPTICYPTDPDQLHDMFKSKAEGLGRRVASVASLLRLRGDE